METKTIQRRLDDKSNGLTLKKSIQISPMIFHFTCVKSMDWVTKMASLVKILGLFLLTLGCFEKTIGQSTSLTKKFNEIDKKMSFSGVDFGARFDSLKNKLGLKPHHNVKFLKPDQNTQRADYKSYLISNDSIIKIDTFKYFMQSAFFVNNKLFSIYLYSIDFNNNDYFHKLNNYLRITYGIPYTSKEGHLQWKGQNILFKLYKTKNTGETTLGSAKLVIELTPEREKEL